MLSEQSVPMAAHATMDYVMLPRSCNGVLYAVLAEMLQVGQLVSQSVSVVKSVGE
jgi:hypothetical protein